MGYFKYKDKQVHYREAGKGTLLLILPGNTASSAAHLDEINYYKDNYHVVSIDFLGTGLSDRVRTWKVDWWRECANQVSALITHLGKDEALIMGTSGGAITGLDFAMHYPGQCRGVIADSCMAYCDETMVKINVVEERKQRLTDQVQFWQYCHGDDWASVVDQDTDMMVRFAKEDGDWYKGQLSKIKCPVLLSGSKQDELLDDYEGQIVQMLKEIKLGSSYIHYSGGHPFMWTKPKVYRDIANQFLNSFQEEE